MCLGCPKHQGPLLGAILHRKRPGDSHAINSSHRISDLERIEAAQDLARIIGWLHTRAGEQSHSKRTCQHAVATHERPTCGSSPMRETRLSGCQRPSLAQIIPLLYLHRSPLSGTQAGSVRSSYVFLCSRGQKRRLNPP